MRCTECEARAARIADLESELAAWRANEADARTGFDIDRVERWRGRLGLKISAAQVVIHVADRAGRVVRWGDVFAATRHDGNARNDIADERNLAMVIVCHARRAMRGTPGEGALERVLGRGVTMSPENAATLKAWVGEAA